MNFHQFREIRIPYGAVKIVESEAATLSPSAVPRTDDMRDMVEHFQRLGMIQRRPAAMQVGDTMIVHPSIAEKLREHCKQKAAEINNRFESMALSVLFGVRP